MRYIWYESLDLDELEMKMVIVLHLWILRDCHQKMNGTYVHNAGLCYFLVTAYPEP